MRGLPLAVKLIVTTAALLAAAVGAAALLSLHTIRELNASEVAARRTSGEAAIQRQAETIAMKSASSAALLLVQNDFTNLNDLVAQTVREDDRIRWIDVVDGQTKRVVAGTAHPPEDKAGKTLIFGVPMTAGGHAVGELRMAVSTAELETELARSIAAARARATTATTTLALVAAFIFLLGIAAAAFQALQIARPIKALSEQAHRIAGGELQHRVSVSSRDEIGLLADDFNFMAEKLVELIHDTASKASLEREMELARQVQESMIPPPRLIEHGPFRIMGYYEPASRCGGDWWTVHLMSDDRTLIAVGDVTGHGVAAAMVAATARGAVEALAKIDERLLTPESILRAIDSAIRGVGGEQLLMTCFAALIDARRGTIDFSNAAHNFPYVAHARPDGAVETLSVLAMRGSPLGSQGELELQSGTKRLTPGDTMVFYTDGVIDRVDAGGNRFGDRRLRHLLLRDSGNGGVAALRKEILAQLGDFAGGQPPDDDVTLVLCRFDPTSAAGTVRRRALG